MKMNKKIELKLQSFYSNTYKNIISIILSRLRLEFILNTVFPFAIKLSANFELKSLKAAIIVGGLEVVLSLL